MITKAILTTVMIGLGNVTSGNSYMIPPPTTTKETVVIEGERAMETCRKLEAAFHNGYSTSSGETKKSVESYDTDRNGLSVRLIRESSCIKVN